MNNTLLKSVVLLSFVSVFNKFTGFGREVALAHYFGTSRLMDDFLFADLIPNLIIYMMQGGMITAFIPIYNELLAKGLKEKYNNLVDILLSFLFISCSLCIFSLMYFGEDILRIFTKGFNEENIQTIIRISYYLLPIVFFNGIFNVLRAIQEARGHFFVPAISLTVANLIIIIATISLHSSYSIYSVPMGMLIAAIMQVLIQVIACRKLYNHFSFCFNFKSEIFVTLVKSAIPILIGNVSAYVIIFNSRLLASFLDVGTISCLNYATKFQLAIYGCIVLPFITVSYPKLIKLNYSYNNVEFYETFRRYLKNGIYILTPVILFIALYSEFLITIVFERGAFNHSSTLVTTQIFSIMTLNLVPMFMFEMCSRFFYIKKAFRVPNIVTVIGVLFNIFFSYTFIEQIGVMSLVYGNILSTVMNVIILNLISSNIHKEIIFNLNNAIKFLLSNAGPFLFFFLISKFIKLTDNIVINLLFVFVLGVSFFSIVLILYKMFNIYFVAQSIIEKANNIFSKYVSLILNFRR